MTINSSCSSCSPVNYSPVPHQVVYTDDDDRTWATDCDCGQVVTIDTDGNYIDGYGQDVPHIVVDSGEGDPDDWYEVFPNGGNSTGDVITIVLQKENDPVSNAALGAINASSQASQDVGGFSRDEFDQSLDYSPPSQFGRNLRGPPSEKIVLQNWSIKQPASEIEYKIMKALIDDPNGRLVAPPHTAYVLDSKIEEVYHFDAPIEEGEEAFISEKFKHLCEACVPGFLSNDPTSLQILKNMHAYFVNSYFSAKENSISFLNNLQKKAQNSCFLEVLDDCLDGLGLHKKTISKVRVCLGHGLYSIELKDTKEVRNTSEKQVNFYERNPNVKKLTTTTHKREDRENSRKSYVMHQNILHVDNYLGCNNYHIESEMLSHKVHPYLGLDILKDRCIENTNDPKTIEELAKNLLISCSTLEMLSSASQSGGSVIEHARAAIDLGCYRYAIENLDQVLSNDPNNSTAYLERSAAHFGLEEYDSYIRDFEAYKDLSDKSSLQNSLEFTKGVSSSLVRGIKDSAKGLGILVVDLIKDPKHTISQVYDGIMQLTELAKSNEWKEIGEILLPEVAHLIKDWGTLDVKERVELIAYSFGKYGADILIPGAAAKIASKSVKSLKGLYKVRNSLRLAERTLVLESVSTLDSVPKIVKTVELNQKILAASNEAGLSARELFKLKEAGKLNGTYVQAYEAVFPSIVARESFELFQKAEAFLKPYRNTVMSEIQIKELIHQTGVKTFPRPAGVPENFKVSLTKKGAGVKYTDPFNSQNTIRVMPGKFHSGSPCQRNPYVIQMKEGKAIDKFGNMLEHELPSAHIPINEFIYKK